MGNFWSILGTSTDSSGLEFIAALESRNFPFFATQFHPEKSAYEWAPKKSTIPHTR